LKVDYSDSGSQDRPAKVSKKEQGYLNRTKKRLDQTQKRTERYLAKCHLCLSNSMLKDEEVLSISDRAFLLQAKKSSFLGNHFVLAPFSHSVSIRETPDEDFADIRNYKKSMIQYFDKFNKSLLFVEIAYNLDKSPHAKIEVFVLDNAVFKTAPSFFTAELNQLDGDWSTHRKIIPIKR
jgi:hypothetical protein